MEVQDQGSQPPGDLAEILGSEGQACLCGPCLEGLSELGTPRSKLASEKGNVPTKGPESGRTTRIFASQLASTLLGDSACVKKS